MIPTTLTAICLSPRRRPMRPPFLLFCSALPLVGRVFFLTDPGPHTSLKNAAVGPSPIRFDHRVPSRPRSPLSVLPGFTSPCLFPVEFLYAVYEPTDNVMGCQQNAAARPCFFLSSEPPPQAFVFFLPCTPCVSAFAPSGGGARFHRAFFTGPLSFLMPPSGSLFFFWQAVSLPPGFPTILLAPVLPATYRQAICGDFRPSSTHFNCVPFPFYPTLLFCGFWCNTVHRPPSSAPSNVAPKQSPESEKRRLLYPQLCSHMAWLSALTF